MVCKKKYHAQIFNKMAQQFLELRRYLRVKPWQHLFKASKPWYLMLSNSDELSKKYFEVLKEKFVWTSQVHEYSDAWPMVNLRLSEQMVLIDVPSSFWQNPGAKILGVLGRWLSFLKLLKKQRWLQPLNAVILLFDFKLLGDEDALKKYLGQLQSVLHDLCAESLAGLPVYVLIDGVDEVSGFHAYMSKLQALQRQQVFGMAGIDDFDNLLAQLNQKILAQLNREKDVLHNAELLRFPLALSAYRQRLKSVCASLQTLGVGCQQLLLRGIYFVDLLDDLFVHSVFKDVILKESALGGIRQAWFSWCEFYKKKILLKAAIFSGVLLILLVLFGVWKLEQHAPVYENSWGVSLERFNDLASAHNAVLNLQSQWQQLMQRPNKHEPADVASFVAQHGNQVLQALQGIDASLNVVQGGNGLINMSSQLLNQQMVAFNQLQRLSRSAPMVLQNAFNSLLQNLTFVVFAATKNAVANLWSNQVHGVCRANLSGFPFQGSSDVDVSLDAFNKMFAADGVSGHVNVVLMPLLHAFESHHSAYGVEFIWPSALQKNIVQMVLIQNVFFNQGHFNVALKWTPVLLSKNLAQFNLNIAGQTLMYQNGPRFAQNISWSFAEPVSLTFTDLNGHVYRQDYGGSWALLRLFNHAQISKVSANHYQVVFRDGDYSATYLVQANYGDFAGVLAVFGFDCG